MKRILPFIIILVVLGVVVFSFVYMTRPKATTDPAANPSPGAQAKQSPTPVPVKTGVPGADPPHTLGPANAPVKLEEFGDFECPPCGMFHPILKQMKEEFGDRLQVTFREYPLANHQHAIPAASAAEAAGLQGKFWEMHALIFEHQNEWKTQFDVKSVFEGYAKQIGIDVERFKRDVTSDRVQQRIFLDGKRARSMGVNSTPTVFINGREVPFQSLPADTLRVLILDEERAVGAQKK
ncbi:MAG TPA: thioredoxin domain-containing protein [Pyrinomonadaceae bacterium]|nr:thioredoxin domain-containing protein [Pyrinomonadaceae bacterium]